MGAIRVEFVSINGMGTDSFPIELDCWSARLILTVWTADQTINQISLREMHNAASFVPAIGGDPIGVVDIDFPGLRDDRGRPVKYNQTLRFNPAGGAMFGVLIRRHYDPDLPTG